MGTDITITAQKREGGRWIDVVGQFHEGSAPFDWRSYGLFAFLAGVRNYSAITPIAEPRGLPPDMPKAADDEWDFWIDKFSHSWLTVQELAAYDDDQIIEDRRVSGPLPNGVISGAITAEPGGGERMSLRDFLMSAYFDDLAELQRIGAERIVFAFDS